MRVKRSVEADGKTTAGPSSGKKCTKNTAQTENGETETEEGDTVKGIERVHEITEEMDMEINLEIIVIVDLLNYHRLALGQRRAIVYTSNGNRCTWPILVMLVNTLTCLHIHRATYTHKHDLKLCAV